MPRAAQKADNALRTLRDQRDHPLAKVERFRSRQMRIGSLESSVGCNFGQAGSAGALTENLPQAVKFKRQTQPGRNINWPNVYEQEM